MNGNTTAEISCVFHVDMDLPSWFMLDAVLNEMHHLIWKSKALALFKYCFYQHVPEPWDRWTWYITVQAYQWPCMVPRSHSWTLKVFAGTTGCYIPWKNEGEWDKAANWLEFFESINCIALNQLMNWLIKNITALRSRWYSKAT